MSKARRELQVLGDWLHTGAQAANVWYRPTAAAGGAELDTGEVAEVVFVEVIPPVTGGGVVEDLRRVQLNLDDQLEEYNLFPGTQTYLVNASAAHMLHGRIMALGKPVWNVSGPGAMLQATCPKYRKKVTIEALAGGAITADYRIRLWGYRYRVDELPGIVSPIGGAEPIRDPISGRQSQVIQKPVIIPNEDTWTQLPGGLDQAVPKIFHFIRLGFNSAATVANTDYEFRFDLQQVANREEDLYWPYDLEKRVLLLKGLGVRAPANLLETWVELGGDKRPKEPWPTRNFLNPLHFGQAQPFYPAGFPLYYPVPLLPDPILVAGEKAVVKVKDDGTSIPANQIAVIVNGIQVLLT